MKELARKQEDLQKMVIKECPLGDDFINSHCPVRNARKLTPQNLGHYVKTLSEEQIDNIVIYHEDCSSDFS